MTHEGGSAVAWVRVVVDQDGVTSIDPDLAANSRLLIEQQESA